MFKAMFTPFEFTPHSLARNINIFWFLCLATMWVFSSYIGDTHLFPTIEQVGKGFVILWNRGLIDHFFSSIWLFLLTAVWSIIVSCFIAYLSIFPFFNGLAKMISSFRFLPLVGVSIYISLIIKDSRYIQISILSIFMTVFLVTSILSNLSELNEEIDHAKTLKCTNFEILKEVIIFGRFDYVIESIRQNLAIIFGFLVVIEMINTASGGLGYLIGQYQHLGNKGVVIALQIIILFTGKFIDWFFVFFRRTLFKYSNF